MAGESDHVHRPWCEESVCVGLDLYGEAMSDVLGQCLHKLRYTGEAMSNVWGQCLCRLRSIPERLCLVCWDSVCVSLDTERLCPMYGDSVCAGLDLCGEAMSSVWGQCLCRRRFIRRGLVFSGEKFNSLSTRNVKPQRSECMCR